MLIRDQIIKILESGLSAAQQSGDLGNIPSPVITLEHPNRLEHGNYSSNLPLRIQGLLKMKALDIAEILKQHVPQHEAVTRIEVAAPGFINFYLDDSWLAKQAKTISSDKTFGAVPPPTATAVQLEYVSANPTGPIHVGNGRGAAIGSTLANTFRFCGYAVQQEYYINDAGNQVAIFGETLKARYLELLGEEATLPENGYPGTYMISLAEDIRERFGDDLIGSSENELENLGSLGIGLMVERIKSDLKGLDVEFDRWFSEKTLMLPDQQYDRIMSLLNTQKQTTERDGAVWFTSSELGESKDNVLIRSDGTPTYFASDIAYHFDKFVLRGFDRVIDIWGADHQGHVSRVKAAVDCVGGNSDNLDVLLYQLVTLKRGEEIVPLSKRAGEIVTLKEVIDEVGKDAARYFFLATGANQTMEFDLDLAVQQSDENPVYYIQYAHARISSILRLAVEQQISADDGDYSLLTHPAELNLLVSLLLFPEVIERVLEDLAPHHLAHYARELAAVFHNFYGNCRVVQEDEPELSKARLMLLEATQTVLANILALMGISAPDSM